MVEENDMTNRQTIVDYLKAIGIILVIIIHSNTKQELGLEKSIIYPFFIGLAVPFFMILSGYTFSISYSRWEKMQDMYKFKVLCPKIIRFLLPAVITIMIYILINGVAGKSINMFDVWVMGIYGQGSYYCHLMIELIIIFLILFQVMRKNLYAGLLLAGMGNVVFEIIVKYSSMSSTIYFRLIFRYMLIVAAGILIYFVRNKKPHWSLIIGSMVLGGIFISIVTWWEYDDIFLKYYPEISLGVVFWCAPIIRVMLYYLRNIQVHTLLGSAMSMVGKTSYHILYTQMTYLYCFKPLQQIVLWRINPWVVLGINILISIVLGVIFYKVETILRKKVSLLFAI